MHPLDLPHVGRSQPPGPTPRTPSRPGVETGLLLSDSPQRIAHGAGFTEINALKDHEKIAQVLRQTARRYRATRRIGGGSGARSAWPKGTALSASFPWPGGSPL